MYGIDRSIVASMIYNIYKNNGKGIEFSEGKSNEANLKAIFKCSDVVVVEKWKLWGIEEEYISCVCFQGSATVASPPH